jgi:PAS domain S-box-containing protein
MLSSESYVELVSQAYNRAQQDGSRRFPVACFEIFMLDQAQQRAKRREAEVFQKLSETFGWHLPRWQRNGYLKELGSGSTLILTDHIKTILWTSNSFLAMTGFTRAESLGQTPGILQGPGTDRTTLMNVRESLGRADSVSADLLNYRKNGEPYLCRVTIDPLFNQQGEPTHFLAVENEV